MGRVLTDRQDGEVGGGRWNRPLGVLLGNGTRRNCVNEKEALERRRQDWRDVRQVAKGNSGNEDIAEDGKRLRVVRGLETLATTLVGLGGKTTGGFVWSPVLSSEAADHSKLWAEFQGSGDRARRSSRRDSTCTLAARSTVR